MFFKPAQKVKLDEFKTDVLYVGGMNPWDSCKSSLYEIAIASSQIVALSVGLFWMFF